MISKLMLELQLNVFTRTVSHDLYDLRTHKRSFAHPLTFIFESEKFPTILLLFIYLLTAIGLTPGGSGYIHVQKYKLWI